MVIPLQRSGIITRDDGGPLPGPFPGAREGFGIPALVPTLAYMLL